ncbi:MAG TPA: TonB-dependent receptor [Puia sp.]|nr:TonB-dependent receptor [Puia sp.]
MPTLLLIVLGTLLSSSALAQDQSGRRAISGTVTDSLGQGMPAVTVTVKGSKAATTTDVNGKFTIHASGNATLVFTSVGYVPREEKVGGRSALDIRMFVNGSNQDLNQVIVVGYGTQKKATVTGAVASIQGADLVQSPAPNLSNSLAGRMPGVMALNTSGEPGYDGATILIRGQATLNNNSPLIVIDGVANRLGGLERLNPIDIESVSVLKDASAAIYGAEGANGVILITTKHGKSGRPTVSFDYNEGFMQPSRLPKMADAATFATIQNEISYYDDSAGGLNHIYTPAQIQKFRDGSDPLNYPNQNWEKAVLKNVALQDKQDLAIRGGNDNITYYLSLGNQYQDGLYKNGATKYKQNNVLSNIDVKVNDKLRFGLNLGYRSENRTTPAGIGASAIFDQIYSIYPTIPTYYPNGLPSEGVNGGQNPAVEVNGNLVGTLKSVTNTFNGTLTGSWTLPVKGLSLDGFLGVDQFTNNSKQFAIPWITYQYAQSTNTYTPIKDGPTQPNLNQSTETNTLVTANLKLNYSLQVGLHSFKAFVAYEQSDNNDATFAASRLNFLSSSLQELSQGGTDPTDYGNSGSSSETTRQNYFGRFNYDYAGKYLLEFQLRDDGSSIFAPGHRYGVFPGVSAGWRIAQENFMKNVDWVNDLKLRASYGKLGNDRVSAYQYLDNFSYQSGVFTTGATQNQIVINYNLLSNPNITWEVSNKYNIGLDGTIFKHLSFELNVFEDKRSNILLPLNASIPGVTGIASSQIPDENIGKAENKGFEANLNYKRSFGKWSFNLGGNFTYARSRVIYQDEAPNTLSYQQATGRPIGSQLLYQAIGIYRTWDQINATPHIPGTQPGDLIYKDVNHDGQITYADEMRASKSNIPWIVYGLTGGASWKNFDLSLLFSGQADVVQYLLPDAGTVGNFPSSWADNRWSPSNPNGTYPRADDRSGEYYGNYRSTFWLRNTSFLRLKNVEVGYTFPHETLRHIGISALRVYANGFNLLTVTSLKDYDPEGNNEQGYFYPQQKIYNLGLNVTF